MATQSSSTTSGITRITGTYSGLDVDALVTAGVASDQSKLDKAKQAEQTMEWQQDQYRKIMTDVTSFYNKYLTSTGDNSLVLSSDWNAMKATSSNETAVTATASTGANAKNYTANVSQLATAASCQIGSSNLVSATQIYINGTPYTLNGTTAQARATDLNSQLLNAGVKVNAQYSDFANNGAGGLILESQTLGKSSSTLTQASLVSATGTDQSITAGTNLNATINDGTNLYTIDDNSTNNTSNSVTLDNVTFKFNALTTTTNPDLTTTKNPVTIGVTKDTSTIAGKLTSFVDDYNTLLKEINGKIYETYDKNYPPLTDAQKSAMSETQITKWETKAQTGLLRQDEYLTSLSSDMKDAMTTMMSGSGFDLEKLGITPVDDYGSLNGTYKVTDKSKLTSALEDNFDKVYDLFNKASSNDTWTKADSSDGILSKLKVGLYNNVTASDSKMAKKAGVDGYSTSINNDLTKAITDQQTLIDTLESNVSDKETALYNKYSILETKLSSLDSQTSALSSLSN